MAEKLIVDANYRFIAAYQEVNTRIGQRQQILALYITLVVGMLAALVALKTSEGKGGNAPVEWLVLGFPVASIFLAFLQFKAERAITNLRRFLSALEQLGNAHEHLPSYNTHPQWAAGANKARKYHDYASAILVAGGNAIGLGALVTIYPQRVQENPVTLYFSILLACLAIGILLMIPKWSYRPETQA